MAMISMSNLRKIGVGPFRKTRNSVVAGDLQPPYTVHHSAAMIEGLWHSFAIVEGAAEWSSCCRMRFAGVVAHDPRIPTCLGCGTCMGCWCCMDGYIGEETMQLGKWETKDGRKLYPFEMDNTHLLNAIAKLRRDKSHFKDDWQLWVKVLECEARLRRLA